MNIVRYQRYPQSDLSVALDRLANMREEMDRVFESPFGSFFRPLASLSRWTPAVDVYHDKDQFTVQVELPGLKKEEIEISLHGDTLTIAGERKPQGNADQGFRTERFFGKFQRGLDASDLRIGENYEYCCSTAKRISKSRDPGAAAGSVRHAAGGSGIQRSWLHHPGRNARRG